MDKVTFLKDLTAPGNTNERLEAGQLVRSDGGVEMRALVQFEGAYLIRWSIALPTWVTAMLSCGRGEPGSTSR